MPDANRTARVTARLRQRERVLLEEAARARGVHLSELVRTGAVREARRALVEQPEVEPEDARG